MMTFPGQWPLSVEATLGMSLSLSEGPKQDDKAKLLGKTHGYLSITQRKLRLGGSFSAQGSLCLAGQKSRGCGAKPRAEAGLFLFFFLQEMGTVFLFVS